MQMGNTEKFILICSSQHILFFSNWDEVDKIICWRYCRQLQQHFLVLMYSHLVIYRLQCICYISLTHSAQFTCSDSASIYFHMAEGSQLNPVVFSNYQLLESPGDLLEIYWFHDFDLFDLNWSSGVRIF